MKTIEISMVFQCNSLQINESNLVWSFPEIAAFFNRFKDSKA